MSHLLSGGSSVGRFDPSCLHDGSGREIIAFFYFPEVLLCGMG